MLDEWKFPLIPKICHAYWGGGTLPYLRYLTLASFQYYNPDWEIILYVPKVSQQDMTWNTHEQKYKVNCDDWFHRLKEIIPIKEIDFAEIGLSNDISEVHKSDFLRWHLLSTIGGVWVDMDILFIKPMTAIGGDNLYPTVDVVYCKGNYGHSIGFLMGATKCDFFNTVLEKAKEAFNKAEYQCIGSVLCNSLPNPGFGYNLPMDVVYAYDANHVKELYADNPPKRLTKNTIGIHWYAGSTFSGEYLNATNGGCVKNDSFIGKQITEFGNKIQTKDIFTHIFNINKWKSKESVSGVGSELETTPDMREQLPILFERYDIKRVLDLGCGDFNWMKTIVGGLDYYMGIDVVSKIIEYNDLAFSSDKVHFVCKNIEDVDEELYQDFDAVIIRDVMVHLTSEEISDLLDRLKLGNIRFLFATNFLGGGVNRDINTGNWRRVNLLLPPFSMPMPIETIVSYREQYSLHDSIHTDKTLALWNTPRIVTDKHHPFANYHTHRQLRSINPHTVTDVGTGDGYWGKVIKIINPCCIITGIELSDKWFNHCEGLGIYEKVIHSDVCNAINYTLGDVIIFGDILEHLYKDSALEVLLRAVQRFKYVIINTPVGFMPQEHEDIEEIHRCGLTYEDMSKYDIIEYQQSGDSNEEYHVFNCLIRGNNGN